MESKSNMSTILAQYKIKTTDGVYQPVYLETVSSSVLHENTKLDTVLGNITTRLEYLEKEIGSGDNDGGDNDGEITSEMLDLISTIYKYDAYEVIDGAKGNNYFYFYYYQEQLFFEKGQYVQLIDDWYATNTSPFYRVENVEYVGINTTITVDDIYCWKITIDQNLDMNYGRTVNIYKLKYEYESNYKTMTAIIDLSNSNPDTCITYADDAETMTAKSEEWDEFFGHYPVLFQNGVEANRLNPNNFTEYESGLSATITSTSGSDVMIAFPRRGLTIKTSDNKVYISMTDAQNDPTFEYNAHTRGTTDKDRFYLGAYKGYAYASNLYSLSGKSPAVSQTIGTFRTCAQNKGSGYELFAFYQLTYIQCMYILKYKSLNSQTALGQGYTASSNSAKINTGGTNAKGMDFGETTGTLQMKLFGLEDFWGNVYDWIDGLYCDSSFNILTGNDGFNNTGSGYTNNGKIGPTSSVSGYMSTPIGTTKGGFIPKACSGSSTTYFSDYAYCYSSYLPIFGGYWSYGAHAGAFRLSVSCSASHSSSSIGARLMYL
jgi:hypothetical protein